MTVPIFALDGEGYTTRTGRHLYTYVACSSSTELVSELYEPGGIRTRRLFEWLLSLPGRARIVGYSLGYDRTKWLEDLPPHVLYGLTHPDPDESKGWPGRMGAWGPRPVTCAGYRINLISTKFTLSRIEKDSRTIVVWDLFKFFQSSFVKSLREWNVGTASEVERIEKMKEKRGNFREIGAEERAYCQSECMLLAKLASELFSNHARAGLELRSFFGPGSTARIVLERTGAKSHGWPEHEPQVRGFLGCTHGAPYEKPEAKSRCGRPARQHLTGTLSPLRFALSSAFFGGRFEQSHTGPIPSEPPLFNPDIASAYAYALALLGCMRHGRWKHIPSPVLEDLSDVAVVSYRLHMTAGVPQAWGPLPHRTPDGDIIFPVAGAGGWAFVGEMREAVKLHPGIELLEAWSWERSCSCPPPFRQEIVELFCKRLEWGKNDGRGRVLKYPLSSMYGVSAQHVGGGGKFRCLVRAGFVTSTIRAMLLQAVLAARSKWNVLELATDSILAREPLTLPAPLPLGTEHVAAKAGKVPLGAWEQKPWTGGVFLMRPGMRFPISEALTVAERFKATAARGVGTKILVENWRRILDAWRERPLHPVKVQQPPIFHGTKSCVRRVLGPADPGGDTPWAFVKDAKMGLWIEPKKRILAYHPGPKRAGFLVTRVLYGDDLPGAVALAPWELPMTDDARSAPYMFREDDPERMMRDEQPEFGLADLV